LQPAQGAIGIFKDGFGTLDHAGKAHELRGFLG
jgi:hypothetical protein